MRIATFQRLVCTIFLAFFAECTELEISFRHSKLLASSGNRLDEPAGEDLKGWLRSLAIRIPQVSLIKAGFNISLTNITCTDIQLGSIVSTVESPLVLSIAAIDIGADCDLAWSYSKLAESTLRIRRSGDAFLKDTLFGDHGTARAVLGGGSSISGPLELQLDNDPVAPLPKHVLARDCHGKLVLTSLEFSSSTLPPFITQILTWVVQYAIQLVPPLLCKKLDEALSRFDLEGIASLVRSQALAPPKFVPPLPRPPGHDILDWQNNRFTTTVMELVTEVIGDVNGRAGINTIMAHVLSSNDGNFSLVTPDAGEPTFFTFQVPGLGQCKLRARSLSVSGLTSFRTLKLEPAFDFLSLDFALALEKLSTAGSINLRCDPALHAQGPALTELFGFSASMQDGLDVSALGDLAVHQNALNAQMLVSPGRCLPGVLGGQQVRQLELNATPSNVVLQPQSGGSLEVDVDTMINALLSMTLNALSQSIAVLAHGLLRGQGRDYINQLLQIPQAVPCPSGPPADEYTYYTTSDAAGILAVLSGIPAVLLLCTVSQKVRLLFGIPKATQRRELALALAEGCPGSHPDDIGSSNSGGTQNVSDDPRLAILPFPSVPSWDCLASHPSIGARAALGVPLLLISIAGLFLCSNMSIGAKVLLLLDLNQQDFLLDGVFDFSLISSIIDMWNSGSYALAILIGFFSGCWPYLKLGLMMYCWYATPERLSLHRRKVLLDFLDAYGKWSLVDTFVLVMFMVSFHIEISSTSTAIQDIIGDVGPIFNFTVLVRPGWSFHCFLAATILSLVAGHLVTYYNHSAGEWDNALEQVVDATPQQANKTRLCRVAKGQKLFEILAPAVLVASIILVMVGSAVESFTFSFSGLAKCALGQELSRRLFSLVSLGQQLPDSSGEPDSPGIRIIQFVFFLFSIGIIVAYHGLLMILWCCPLLRRRQKALIAVAKMLQAWSAIDVFVVSVIAAVLEISKLVTFVVGDKCSLIEKVLRNPPAVLAHRLPQELVEHPSCVELSTTLAPGCWCLFAGALVSTVVGQVIISLMEKQLSADETAETRESVANHPTSAEAHGVA